MIDGKIGPSYVIDKYRPLSILIIDTLLLAWQEEVSDEAQPKHGITQRVNPPKTTHNDSRRLSTQIVYLI